MNVGDRVLTDKGAGTVIGFLQDHRGPYKDRRAHVHVVLDAGYKRYFPPDQVQSLEEETANG